MPDDVLKRLQEKDGVVMVNFFSGLRRAGGRENVAWKYMDFERELKKKYDDQRQVDAELKRWKPSISYPRGTIHDLLDHIDHIAKVAGRRARRPGLRFRRRQRAAHAARRRELLSVHHAGAYRSRLHRRADPRHSGRQPDAGVRAASRPYAGEASGKYACKQVTIAKG